MPDKSTIIVLILVAICGSVIAVTDLDWTERIVIAVICASLGFLIVHEAGKRQRKESKPQPKPALVVSPPPNVQVFLDSRFLYPAVRVPDDQLDNIQAFIKKQPITGFPYLNEKPIARSTVVVVNHGNDMIAPVKTLIISSIPFSTTTVQNPPTISGAIADEQEFRITQCFWSNPGLAPNSIAGDVLNHDVAFRSTRRQQVADLTICVTSGLSKPYVAVIRMGFIMGPVPGAVVLGENSVP